MLMKIYEERKLKMEKQIELGKEIEKAEKDRDFAQQAFLQQSTKIFKEP